MPLINTIGTRLKSFLVFFLLSIIGIETAVLLSYHIAHEYFFDKFFYTKSLKYGYGRGSSGSLDPVYGERNKDLRDLEAKSLALFKTSNSNILGASTPTKSDGYYTVALIGDSFVWGMGLLPQDTLAKKLETRLNKYRKTNVMSFGEPAFSIADYAKRYNLVNRLYHVDLYIFLMVMNDALLTKGRDYSIGTENFVKDCTGKFPPGSTIFDPTSDLTPEKYFNVFEKSLLSPANICVVEESLKRLPTADAIYLMPSSLSDKLTNIYYSKIVESNKKVLLMEDGKNMQKYRKAWENTKLFRVSGMDSHPSKLAVEMFADIITKETLNGNQYEFK